MSVSQRTTIVRNKQLCETCLSHNNRIKGEFLVISHLIKLLPEEPIEVEDAVWDTYKLADPEFNKSDRIDLIIESDLYPKIIKEGIKKYNDVVGQETIFGWIISGQLPTNTIKNQAISDLNLERFWEIDDENNTNLQEDEKCQELYKTTTTRDTDGRFMVQIPFKEELSLGNSRKQAVARLINLEKKMKKEIKSEYIEFMREYER
ncbi:uncharacterized protein LOC119664074 [Teleopsis dalmanni]|uniref:uncharacterized protein LOC119664074 n=1 Tax=Teleopsis dalmanni TaxID=139649 RepID=UPI0018CD2F7A|nr:uncharacterized protein LOC119664074 [Teleopsis dalmanni]